MSISTVEVLNLERVKKLLEECDLRRLFIEELGWDSANTNLDLNVNGGVVRLIAVAQKRGLGVFEHKNPTGDSFPNYAERAAIETAAAKLVHEHLIIFSSHDRKRQVWQWAKRELGKPIQRREHSYYGGRRPDLLVQKLSRLVFSLEAEESGITVIDVAGRLKAGFDVAPITKRFYDGFQAEHEEFLREIKGVPDEGTRRWYASVMLNRLMFVYFIQEKGFLHNDALYLQTKLAESQQGDKDRYLREYLFPLFFDCLARPESQRPDVSARKIGKVPFLNGGLFRMHQIEIDNPKIAISDEAFARLYRFFGSYRWHLDERPISEGNEINPDVLGYIFERYVNQAQMGAYYTKEDITEYMATFAILPRLLGMIAADKAMAKSAGVLWQFLRDEPDRYIFPAMRYGLDVPLPKVTGGLNEAAPPELALATETWAEMLRRREHCAKLREKIRAGRIVSATDCLEENLNLRQLVQDAIERSADQAFLEAVYDAVTEITVLDPACGSGAFLFAAMNILEPIYEACLDKMYVMLEGDHLRGAERLEKKFSEIVTHSIEKHPNQRYFILKQLALKNLFGVDIMEEAVEICKLRLFLKLISQVDRIEDVEPLPDIDFNVKVGNSLVGFPTLPKLERAVSQRFDFGNDLQSLRDEASRASEAFDVFRTSQADTHGEREDQDKQKEALSQQLDRLQGRLNRYLARQYGVDDSRESALERWREVEQPFHWLADFFGIMSRRRFDVVIGNPPYVVYPSVKVAYKLLDGNYSTLPCKNLYAVMLERALELIAEEGIVSFIVQLTVTSSERVSTLQKLLIERGPLFYTSFPRRPQTVFEGVEMPVTILTSLKGKKGLFSTRVERFYASERGHVMTTLSYLPHNAIVGGHRLGKMTYDVELGVFSKLNASKRTLEMICTRTSAHVIYYQEACRYWAKVALTEPYAAKNGIREFPDHWRKFALNSAADHRFAFCLLNSSLFYWYYSVFSDCEHINDSLVKGFPIPARFEASGFGIIAKALDRDLKANATRKVINTKRGDKIEYDELSAAKSKPLIDDVDAMLAEAYGLSEAELKFIRTYDVKYRVPDED
jgi:hypothetical protein